MLALVMVSLRLEAKPSSGRKPQFPNKAAVVKLVADTLYLEAGGEGREGRMGVASVIYNRSSTWLDMPKVILSKRQFSCWNNRSPLRYSAPNNESYRWCVLVAKDMVAGEFFTPLKFRGAVFYHEQSVKPSWRRSLVVVAHVGRHIFYKERSFLS